MGIPKREFESPSPHFDYQYVKQNFAKSLPTFYHYRKPEIKRTRGKIYIEYYYRVPVDLRPLFDNQEWHRFRIREDINRRKEDREAYAEWWRSEIEESLKRGYNPFNNDVTNEFIEGSKIEEIKELNATDAMLLFLETWNKRGLELSSYQKYKKVIGRFIEWLTLKRIPYTDIKNITRDHVESFLNDMKKQHGFSNREYNNHYDFLRTAFNFLVDKKHIADSPCKGIKKQKSKSTKHRYYDEKSLDAITKAMAISDPYCLLAFQTIYYLCIRSDKELMNLKVGNIKFEQNKILSFTKGNSERYIPMDENIKQLFLKHGINKYPENYFVFGIKGTPSNQPFGKGFFSKRFRKARELAQLSKDFTLYSAKHTRIIHLKQDGATDADIMSLTGHKDFTAYAKYLRDIGMNADAGKLNKISRKI